MGKTKPFGSQRRGGRVASEEKGGLWGEGKRGKRTVPKGKKTKHRGKVGGGVYHPVAKKRVKS